MKKLLLFSALGALAFDASAQLATSTSIVEFSSKKNNTQVVAGPQIDHSIIGTSAAPGKSTAKTTGSGGTRLYSFNEYLTIESTGLPSTNPIPPYMWHRNNGKAIYSDPSSVSGVVADTITLVSYGTTFDPAFDGFNDLDAYPSGTEIAINRTTPYKVDSVIFYGVYGRSTEASKLGVVDTLRIGMVHGFGASTDLPIYYFTGMASRFGSDTVRFALAGYDSVTSSISGSTLVIKDVLLTNASLGDTIPGSGGVHRIAVPLTAFNVPAGEIVGTSVTFKTGDPDFRPYIDTVFVGSLDAANPFRFGMFRPLIKEEATFTYPRYFPGAYNTGFVEFMPERVGWEDDYLPVYAFTSDSFTYDIPLIEYVVTCATCGTTSISGAEKVVANATAFPNPANSEINVRFTARENAKANVTIVNTLGQLVAVQNLGVQSAGQTVTATFNTAAFSSGIYFYTIEANGQRTTSRFSVTH